MIGCVRGLHDQTVHIPESPSSHHALTVRLLTNSDNPFCHQRVPLNPHPTNPRIDPVPWRARKRLCALALFRFSLLWHQRLFHFRIPPPVKPSLPSFPLIHLPDYPSRNFGSPIMQRVFPDREKGTSGFFLRRGRLMTLIRPSQVACQCGAPRTASSRLVQQSPSCWVKKDPWTPILRT